MHNANQIRPMVTHYGILTYGLTKPMIITRRSNGVEIVIVLMLMRKLIQRVFESLNRQQWTMLVL